MENRKFAFLFAFHFRSVSCLQHPFICVYICVYICICIYIHIAVYICSCLNSISKYYPNLCLPCLAMPIFSLFSTFIPWLISVFITIFLFHSVASTSATLLSIHFYILPMNNSIYPKTLSSQIIQIWFSALEFKLPVSSFCQVTAGGASRTEYMLVFDQHNCSEELQDLSCGLDYHIIRTFLNVISNQFLRFFIVTFFSKMSFALIHGINRPQLWSSFQSPDGMLESFRL